MGSFGKKTNWVAVPEENSYVTRLLIHVEGETEETFVNELLAPHLYQSGYLSVSARLIGNSRQRDRRGGIRAWSSVRNDILNHLREDTGCLATTLVDYYALPQGGPRAWPDRQLAGRLPFAEKSVTVEKALLADIRSLMDADFDSRRFLPFVMIHEFEGLLFSDCASFGRGIGRPDLIPSLQAVRDQFNSPEEINDSPETAPSKRVRAIIPEYEKPLFGTLAALEIGLDVIRAECPHFRQWLEKLESLASLL